MTTTKYSNKIKKLPQELKAPLFRTILNNSFFNFSWGTSAEAYMTYFLFNRCTINLCVRPSTNAFDIASPVLLDVTLSQLTQRNIICELLQMSAKLFAIELVHFTISCSNSKWVTRHLAKLSSAIVFRNVFEEWIRFFALQEQHSRYFVECTMCHAPKRYGIVKEFVEALFS